MHVIMHSLISSGAAEEFFVVMAAVPKWALGRQLIPPIYGVRDQIDQVPY